jgi:hypothetical protein
MFAVLQANPDLDADVLGHTAVRSLDRWEFALIRNLFGSVKETSRAKPCSSTGSKDLGIRYSSPDMLSSQKRMAQRLLCQFSSLWLGY